MAEQNHSVEDLTPADVAKGIAEGKYLLVDVREPNEVAAEAYPDAAVVPLSSFDPASIPDPKGKQVVFACRSGKRSVTASLAAQAAGLALRQASRRRHSRLEGGGPADQDRRLTRIAMNPIYANLPTTVFEVMSQLAREHDAINLGQGFPDDPGPEDVRRKAAEAALDGYNQYPPMMGLPELRAAIATPLRPLARPQARSADRGDGDVGRHRSGGQLACSA